MRTHLAKRGSTYYFRRLIPTELRPVFDGKSEFMVSLQAKDREAAKPNGPAWDHPRHAEDNDHALAG